MGEPPLNLASLESQHLPALASFVREYLDQDFSDEHRTVARAFHTFWSAANDEVRQRFLLDWRAFAVLAEASAWSEVQRALGRLGAAWIPPNRRIFGGLTRAVNRRVT